MKANEMLQLSMTETTFQHVSVSKLSCTSFTDRSFLPMVPLVLSMVPLAADTVQGSVVDTGKITNGTIGGIPNVAIGNNLQLGNKIDWLYFFNNS